MSDIDNLQIKIRGEANGANTEIDSVIDNLKKLKNSLGKISLGSNTTKGLKSLSTELGKTSQSMKMTRKHTHSLAAAFGKFYASYFLVIRGTKQLGKSIKSAMDYIETLNYFEAGFGKVAESAKEDFKQAGYESAEAYAKSFEDRAKKVTEQMSGFKISDTGELIPGMGKSLGMNPEQLMQYQAVFAQMSDSMGVTAETSLKLSNALTKIGADLASVKNMDFDEVWKDMQSGLVGMSRTLDKYGINIRNVNMQQKLTELGINANINALNQSDKALLRTIILLDSSRFAWGDLANTMQSPANQLRLLKAGFQNLARTIGEVFIPVLGKILPVINAVVAGLQRLVYAIGKIFGIKFNSGRSRAVTFGIEEDTAAAVKLNDELEDSNNSVMLMDEGLDDVNTGLKDASKNAKKLQDHLLGIDELNVYRPEVTEPSGGGAGGGAGGGGAGGGGGGGAEFDPGSGITGLLEQALDDLLEEYEKSWDEAFSRMEKRANEFVDNILKAFQRNGLEGVGEFLSRSLEKALRDIDWDKIYRAAENFGTGLADFLNGLIRPETFGALGMTIANALNAALKAAFSFADKFDFKNLGEAIAQGINELFFNFDFKLLAKTINKWVLGILDTIITAIKKTDWGLIGRKIGEFLENIQFTKIGLKFGKLLWEAMVAGLKAVISSFNVAPIETAIIVALGLNAFKSTKLYKELAKIGEIVKDTVKSIAGDTVALGALSENFPKFAEAVNVARMAFANFRFGIDQGNFGTGVVLALQTIRENLTAFQKGIIGVVSTAGEFVIVRNAFEDIAMGVGNLGLKLAEIGAAAGVAALALYTAFGPAGLVIAGITAVTATVAGLENALKDMATSEMFETIAKQGTVSMDILNDAFIRTVESITAESDTLNEKIKSIGETKDDISGTVDSLGYLEEAISKGAYTAEEKVPEIIQLFNQLLSDSKSIFNEEYDVILQGLLSASDEVVKKLNVKVPEMISALALAKNQGDKELAGLTTSAKTLIKQFEDGSISAEEFATKMQPLIEKLRTINGDGTVDKTTESLEKFGGALDLNKFIKDGAFDASTFKSELGKALDAASNGKDTLDETADGYEKSLNDLQKKFEALGVDTSKIDWEKLLGVNEAETAKGKAAIDKAALDYANNIRDKLLEHTKGMGESQREAYKKEVYDPALKLIQESLQEAGISTAPFAEESAKKTTEAFGTGIDSSFGANVTDPLDMRFGEMWQGSEEKATEAKDNTESIWSGVSDWFGTNVLEPIKGFLGDLFADVPEVWSGLGQFFSDLWEGIKGIFKSAWEFIKGFGSDAWTDLKTIWTGLGQFFSDLWEGVKSVFSGAWDFIKGIWSTVSGWFSEKVIEPLKSFFSGAWETIKGFFSGAWDFIKEIWSTVSGWFSSNVIEPLKTFFQNAWEKIKGFFSGAWDFIKGIWSKVSGWFSEKVIEPTKEFFRAAWETIKGFFSKAWTFIQGVWSKVSGWFSSNVIEPLKTFFSEAWETIKKFFSDAWEEIKRVWNKASNWFRDNVTTPIKNKFTTLKDDIVRAFSNAWEGAKGKWEGAADWFKKHVISPIRKMIDSIWDAISNADEATGKAADKAKSGSKSTLSLSVEPLSIQGYATGGFPSIGDLFFANERGIPELVGTMNGRTAVASGSEITGIKEAVYQSGDEQAKLLQTAVQLLNIISNKETSIEIDGRELVSVYNKRSSRNGFSFT